MKRFAILAIVLTVAGCAEHRSHRPAWPKDAVVSHQPWCAAHVEYIGDTIILHGAHRGVCTQKDVP